MVLTQDVTVTDIFCGCGGSSDAARRTNRGNRQVRIKYAINHWARAIETHTSNFPDTTHVKTDINDTKPEHFEPTTLLLASPECTNHALAKGKRRKNLGQLMLPLEGEEEGGSLVVEAEERSRCTM
jgi:DNA (cytosine-5)-methyltransferase 1